MSLAFPKRGRICLYGKAYEELLQGILRRDGWRCQRCGKRRDLQVHHIEPRSRLRKDEEQNLITLCAECHGTMHRNG